MEYHDQQYAQGNSKAFSLQLNGNAPNGVLIFDESGFVKKGNESVGVAKQYCGNVGKVENSQVGVFTAYASPSGYSIIDKRLFLPKKWFTDDFKEKRNKCKVPSGLTFKTKPQLAAEMLEEIDTENILPYKYILADSLYGSSPEFIQSAEKITDATYFVGIPSVTLCWLQRPVVREKKV